jgi:hypothetical protein
MAEKNYYNGIGFTGVLGVAFIILKIIGKITWPWIWVLSPLWIPFVIVVLILIGILVYYWIQIKK